jgi:hypothetical protein
MPGISSLAQSSLEGTVLEFKTGKPVIAANIVIRNTNKGTVTDD